MKLLKKLGNTFLGTKACSNKKLCANCGSIEELKSDLAKYEKLVKNNPKIQNEFLKKKGETNLPLNDNRYHFCYNYRSNTLGFYSYQEAVHTFKRIFEKEK